MSKKPTMVTGRFQGSGKGFGFCIPDEGRDRGDDCFIPPRKDGGAWDGDRVEVELEKDDPRDGGRRVGQVVRILERTNHHVCGTIQRIGMETWLIPDNQRLPGAVRITGKAVVREGEKAAVAMTSYGSAKHPPMGTLKEVFGPAGSRAAAVEAILYQNDIQREFPEAVTAQADATPQHLRPADKKGRLDLRHELAITIDGETSKDFDDAVSLKRDGAGNWVLGVHIADVSYYVRPNTPMDKEAFHRGTSVYFADQVAPMLPAALSNGICSLNPRADRLALSCIMTIAPDGTVKDYEIVPALIRSARRMTYENCNLLLEGGHKSLEQRYVAVLPMLKDMAALSAVLEQKRKGRGSLELASAEQQILCDDEGVPVDIQPRVQGVSERLIESFMLIANETVARHLFEKRIPGVYRIHEKPSQDKTDTLKAMLSPLGYSLREADHKSLQKVLDDVKGKPEAPAVNMMVLRSMMKARYDTENLGHFGLAAPLYCHFTAPIRRYPDLMVHRCLHAAMAGMGAAGVRRLTGQCEKAADQSSRRELAAQTAERDIEKLYLAEYMQNHIGEQFAAAISGVTKFGLFAVLPNGIEGFIPLETLPRDRYDLDEVALTLTGRRTGASYTFGMTLEVVCVAADAATGRVDFRLPGCEEDPADSEDRELIAAFTPRKKERGGRIKGKFHSGKPAMHVPKGKRRGKRR